MRCRGGWRSAHVCTHVLCDGELLNPSERSREHIVVEMKCLAGFLLPQIISLDQILL